MAKRFDGKVAIVTGSATGIGRASARELGRNGARVACTDIDAAGAERTAKEIATEGGEAIGLHYDVTDPAAGARVMGEIVKRFGGLHVAHVNAGIAAASSILDTSFEEWKRVNAVNYDGVFLSLQAAARAIRDTGVGGAIVITSSDAGLRGGAGMGTYCASKHGVLGLMKCAMADLAPHKIRVNAICPGVIDTPILGPAHKNEAMRKFLGATHPIGRVGEPEEVGRVVAFLLSDDASFVSGVPISIDGGLNAVFGSLGQAAAGGSLDFFNKK